MRLKFGLKIIGNNEQLLSDSIKFVDTDMFDYIELLIPPTFNLSNKILNKISKIKLILHCPHENYGVDIGRKEKREFTIKMIKKSLQWMEKTNAIYLIIHCGTGNIEVAKENLKLFKDYKDLILLENMPMIGLNGEICLGYNAKSFRDLNVLNFGLCFDIGHAIKSSISLGVGYRDIILEFMQFNPRIFHISDGKFDKEIDEHLNIGEGEYDFEFINKIIRKSSSDMITLETPRNNNIDINEDLKNLEKLKNLLVDRKSITPYFSCFYYQRRTKE